MRKAFFSVPLFLLIIVAQNVPAQVNNKSVTATPVLFEPSKISDAFPNRDMTISPDGNELFYTIQFTKGFYSVIMRSVKKNGEWTIPEVASFSGRYKDLEASFSPDGNTLYFSSDRPLKDSVNEKDFDIWYVTKVNGAWQDPQNLGAPVNTTTDEYCANVTKSGNLYFTRDNKERVDDIWMCRYVNGHYEESKPLSDSINSAGYEFNSFVDPDEKFIIYTAYRRPEGLGSGDLYISKMNNNGEWGKAVNLKAINSPFMDYCPFVSADKKYLYFTSERPQFNTPFDKPLNAQVLNTILHSPGNGFDDIYRVNAGDILK